VTRNFNSLYLKHIGAAVICARVAENALSLRCYDADGYLVWFKTQVCKEAELWVGSFCLAVNAGEACYLEIPSIPQLRQLHSMKDQLSILEYPFVEGTDLESTV
jgi:hypothetical protein